MPFLLLALPVVVAVGANVAASGLASTTTKLATRRAGLPEPDPLVVGLATAATLVGVSALTSALANRKNR